MSEDWETLEAMERFGGGFVRQLAKLAAVADPVNFLKIKATWPNYFAEYADMVPLIKARDEAQRGA